ncbi:MAG: hypothetical protein AAGJ18_10650 [Bacteroidota bacterium]
MKITKMYHWTLYSFSWGSFFLAACWLLLLYFVLYVVEEVLQHRAASGRFQNQLRRWSHRIFIVYELLALVVLSGIFILIDPYLHGIILLILAVGSLPYLRSYISGRWVEFDNSITEGVELKTADLQGVVLNMKRTKMKLQTSEGLHHLNYTKLLSDGYTLVSGDEIGGYYHLELSPQETLENIKNHRLHLLDLFVMAPYVDWHHRPELFVDDDAPDTVDARILIREESHLHELIALIKEWGYHCKIRKTK